jgi:alkyl sulfatase BDS1-like metallo-beta-lactamase superfamily hydrolase
MCENGGFENWSWALKLTTMILELKPDDAQARSIRAKAARAIGQRTTSANARGFYITEALAMENKLKLGEHPITLDIARVLLGTPNVDKIMVMPLDDSFQFIRYLVDSRKVAQWSRCNLGSTQKTSSSSRGHTERMERVRSRPAVIRK